MIRNVPECSVFRVLSTPSFDPKFFKAAGSIVQYVIEG